MQTHANTCLRNHWTASWDQDAASALGAACDPPQNPEEGHFHIVKKDNSMKGFRVGPCLRQQAPKHLASILIAKALPIRKPWHLESWMFCIDSTKPSWIMFSHLRNLYLLKQLTHPMLQWKLILIYLSLVNIYIYTKIIYTYLFTFNTTKYNICSYIGTKRIFLATYLYFKCCNKMHVSDHSNGIQKPHLWLDQFAPA